MTAQQHNEPPVEFLPVETSQVITTPGVRTTEFWLAALVVVCATVLLALGKIDATAWTAAVGIGSGGYSIGRGLAKL